LENNQNEQCCEEHKTNDTCCGDHAHEGDEPYSELAAVMEASLEDKLKEAEDKYLRMYAEFENTRKRLEREKSQAVDFASERFAKDMLGIADSLEMAVSHLDNASDIEMIKEGVKLTLDNLLKTFEKHGVKAVAVDGGFDPNFHEAVMQSNVAEYADNAIVATLQKGYTIKDRVLRPSLVNVNKK
jgi:molecular chaperone GrpE